MNKLYFTLFSIYVLSLGTVQAQKKFNVGDEVEIFSAGDARHGYIVKPYTPTEFGYAVYEVHVDGEKYCQNHTVDTRINAEFVRERFQTNSKTEFAPGNAVEVRRYNGSIYPGKVAGRDGDRYLVEYIRDGYETSDWFHVNNVRARAVEAAPATTIAAQTSKAGSTTQTAAKTTGWAAQRFQVGDEVLYDDLGFLVTKSVGIVVGIDSKKRQYIVRDKKDASWKYSYPCYQVMGIKETPDNDFFIGKWEVRIIGTVTTTTKNNETYRNFSGGMKLPPLEIKADGTYNWWISNQKVIRGKWIPREGVRGITLLKALEGKDYTIYEKTEGFATTKDTRDEIGLHHLPSSTGYYHAYRLGPNKSCVLADRQFH